MSQVDLNLGPSRIAVVEDCKALTTQPPRLDDASLIQMFIFQIPYVLSPR